MTGSGWCQHESPLWLPQRLSTMRPVEVALRNQRSYGNHVPEESRSITDRASASTSSRKVSLIVETVRMRASIA